MKILNNNVNELVDDTQEVKDEYDVDFDHRWDAKFGEPCTEVFTYDEFKSWMEEVIEFE